MIDIQSKAKVEELGYALIRELRPELALQTLVEDLGKVADMGAGRAFSVLTPTPAQNASPVSYSGLYGLGMFPFHTDLAQWRRPPRYLVLRCLVGFLEVPTLLLDGSKLTELVGRNRLARALVRPRRPLDGKLSLLRLYEKEASNGRIRWDEKFIEPSGATGTSVSREFRSAIASLDPIIVDLHQPGDTLIVDNWRMLHSRGPVPDHCLARRIDRAYMEEVH